MKHEFNALLLDPEKSNIEKIQLRTDFLNGKTELSNLMRDQFLPAIQVDTNTVFIFSKNGSTNCATVISGALRPKLDQALSFTGKILVLGGNIESSEFCDVDLGVEEMKSRVIFSQFKSRNITEEVNELPF